MAGELDPNADLFGMTDEEEDAEAEEIRRTFGLNPNRTAVLDDLFGPELIETVNEEEGLPEDAKLQLVFKMTANSVLDMFMEALDPELRDEVASCLDGYLGVCLVNKRFQVDLIGEMMKALDAVEQDEGESDEEFDRRLEDLEEQWWGIAQPMLNGRNPDDATREETRKYGLFRCPGNGSPRAPRGSSSSWASTPSSTASPPSRWRSTSG